MQTSDILIKGDSSGGNNKVLATLHKKWAIASAIMVVLMGVASYTAGWKANIEQSAIERYAIRKVLNEHDPLMERVSANAGQIQLQNQRIVVLETSVSNLIKKMDELTQLMIEDRYRARPH